MEQSSRTWARKLTIAIALVVGLLAAAVPASAAPSTKNYSAALAGSTDGGKSVAVAAGGSATLVLTNRLDSQQGFGSAQLDFASTPTTSGVSAVGVSRAGWTVQEVTKGARYLLLNSGTLNPVPPGGELQVTITTKAPTTGKTELRTEVRQSNDFKGTNNDFTLIAPPSLPLIINTVGSCQSSCTPTTQPSPINNVTAKLTINASAPFTFTAGFTPNRLSCDTIPFGPTVIPEPFQVDTTSTSPLSKTLVLTFPKALSVLVPDNGTPRHPVCAGGDVRFPGGKSAGHITHAFEGLLLNCDDPVYLQTIAQFQDEFLNDPDHPPYLPMCVSARARSAGKLVVTIQVQPTTFDPRFW